MVENEKITGIDSVFLSLDTPTTHQAIASFCVLDGTPDFQVLLDRIPAMLQTFPRLRRRPDLKSGYWVDDDNFDLKNHLEYVHVTGMHTHEELFAAASKKLSQGLSFDRPLWRFSVISNQRQGEESDGGIAGMLFCIHHALADGIGGLELVEMMGSSSESRARAQEKAATKSASSGTRQIHLWQSLRRWGSEFFSAKAKTCLTGQNSTARELHAIDFDLHEFQKLKRATGTSFNDVVLALVTGTVRRYQLLKNDRAPVRVIVPVSLRKISEQNNLGNRLSAVGVELPTYLDSPGEQLDAVSKYFKELKEDGSLGAYGTLGQILARLPRSLQRLVSEAQAKRTSFICTNMPNARQPRFLGGAQIVSNYGIAALLRGHGVAFGFITYTNRVCAVIISDPAIVPNAQELLECMQHAAEDLLNLSAPRQAVAQHI